MQDSSTKSCKCSHCQRSFPLSQLSHSIDSSGREVYFCCNGCESVYKLLHQSGFGGFYERLGEMTLEPLGQRRVDFSYLDEPSFLEQHTRQVGELNEVSLVIEGIHCAACIWLNEHMLCLQGGIKKAHINYTSNKAKILFDPKQIRLSTIFGLIESIGYSAHIYDPMAQEEQLAKAQRSFFVSFVVGVFCTMSIMMVAIAQYVGYFYGMQPLMKDVLNLIACLLAAPVLFYTGRVFFSGAYYGLKLGYVGMDFLVAFGASLTFIYSIYASITRSGESYFESVAMIILFVFSGKFLEMRARRVAGDSLDKLHNVLPHFARVERDGSVRTCDVKDLRIGERVHIAVGEMLPCDGVACNDVLLDMRSLSGESLPVSKKRGQELLSGSVVLERSLIYEVRKRYVDSTMSQIITLLEESLSSAPRIQNLANALAKYFSRFVLFIALCGFVYWWLDSGVNQALVITISVIVIACPCALALATPIASVVGISRAYRALLVFKEARFLEVLARAKAVVFDKTGTLTNGTPKVQYMERFGEFDESVLAHFVRLSSHPISKAVAECFAPGRDIGLQEVSQQDSRGIKAYCGGVEIVGGSLEFLRDNGVADLALGEQCGSIADFVKGTNAKFANLPQNERSEVSLENPQSSHSPTAIPRILEEEKGAKCEKSAPSSLRGEAEAIHTNAQKAESMDCHEVVPTSRNDRTNSPCEKLDSSDNALSPSSRADEIGVAIHNSAPAESNQINNAHKVRNLESVVGGLGGVRGDKGGELANSNPLSPLEKNLSQAELKSSDNEKKVESTFAKLDSSVRVDSMDYHALPSDNACNDKSLDSSNTAISLSLRGGGKATNEAIHKDKLDSSVQVESSESARVDCHALPSDNARNDRNSSALDRHADKNACNDRSRAISKTAAPSTTAQKLDAMSVFGYGIDKELKLLCYLSDEPKAGAKELIEYLHSSGKQVWLLSGDRAGAVESVARSLGIAHYRHSLLPAQKAQYIKDLQASPSTQKARMYNNDAVVMIGDGLNDIVALKNADVGISMGAGSDIAIAQSDIVVLDDSLSSVQAGFAIAKETYTRIYQNLAISLAYNALLIPLALCGFVIPLVAALSMSLSSLLVVGNSLRKGRGKGA